MLLDKARRPHAIFVLSIRPALWLLIRKLRGKLSVVPRNEAASVVPLLPVVCQSVPLPFAGVALSCTQFGEAGMPAL